MCKIKIFPCHANEQTRNFYRANISPLSSTSFPRFAPPGSTVTPLLSPCNCFIIVRVEEKCECTWCLISLNCTSDALLPYNAGSREISQSIMCVITTPIFLFKGQLWGTMRASKRRRDYFQQFISERADSEGQSPIISADS
jgi:hypothetical protein